MPSTTSKEESLMEKRSERIRQRLQAAQLEENTKQAASNMALVNKVLLGGKAKNVPEDEAFPVSSDKDLVALELKISESEESKNAT